jgi:hypothetical protein
MSESRAGAVGGLFVPLTEAERSRVSALLGSAGLSADGQGIREFLLSKACHVQQRPTLFDQAARFAQANPDLVDMTKEVARAFLQGRPTRLGTSRR